MGLLVLVVQMKFYYNKDWNIIDNRVDPKIVCSNEILLQQRLKRYGSWVVVSYFPSSNEILLQQRLKPGYCSRQIERIKVQMKFYYNKDWNSLVDMKHVGLSSSNEILLQQRLKQKRRKKELPPWWVQMKFYYNKDWNEAGVSQIDVKPLVQMKFYYNKDWNEQDVFLPYFQECSNEILLQQRLKPWFRHITNYRTMFKWNSITTKIETIHACCIYLLVLGSNEILLQQRLKLHAWSLFVFLFEFKWNSITTKIETRD